MLSDAQTEAEERVEQERVAVEQAAIAQAAAKEAAAKTQKAAARSLAPLAVPEPEPEQELEPKPISDIVIRYEMRNTSSISGERRPNRWKPAWAPPCRSRNQSRNQSLSCRRQQPHPIGSSARRASVWRWTLRAR